MKPLILASLLSLTAFAADDDGFKPLFNGRDLSGWVNANCAPETWSVTNGMIHCTGRPTGAMRTDRQYENFILEVEWRHLSSGGNSGVFIWGTPIAAPGVPFLRGIEVQVLDHGFNIPGKNQWYTTHGDVFPIHGASMKPFGKHNGDRSFPSEERSKGFPEWNHYRIVCTNGVLRLSVNGKEVSGGEDCNYRKGFLALESEGAPVEFRNIRIKELPSNNPAPELCAPVDESFRAIFTGLDLRGWETNANTVAHWRVEGERLRLKSSETLDAKLITEKQYASAEFILDVQPVKNSTHAPAIEFLGAYIPLECSNEKWTRFRITSVGDKVTVRANDKEVASHTVKIGVKSSLNLCGTGSDAAFMNLYARETPVAVP
jgi:hypothetical protein